MQHENWKCPKCDHNEFEVAEMRASGGMISAMFDVSNARFTSVSCTTCQYTEFYRTSARSIDKVLDFFAT